MPVKAKQADKNGRIPTEKVVVNRRHLQFLKATLSGTEPEDALYLLGEDSTKPSVAAELAAKTMQLARAVGGGARLGDVLVIVNDSDPNAERLERLRLSPQQEQAADLLAVGTNVTDAADAVGVTRQTVSGWLNGHAGFQAALNARRQNAWGQCADRLRSLVPKAVDKLETELNGPNGLKAAEMILKAAGLLADLRPTGSTDPLAVEKEKEEARTINAWVKSLQGQGY